MARKPREAAYTHDATSAQFLEWGSVVRAKGTLRCDASGSSAAFPSSRSNSKPSAATAARAMKVIGQGTA